MIVLNVFNRNIWSLNLHSEREREREREMIVIATHPMYVKHDYWLMRVV